MEERLKKSLRLYLVFSFVGLLAFILLLCGLANMLFLESYYHSEKGKSLVSAYRILKRSMADGAKEDLAWLSTRYDLSIIVLDTSSNTVILAGAGEEPLKTRLLDILFEASGAVSLKKEVLEQTKEYSLWISSDERTGTDYIELWGTLSGGQVFLMQSPLESMTESASVANRFLLYIGLFGMLVGGIIVWVFSAPLEKRLIRLQRANEELQLDLEHRKKLDEMRREFITNASHELKTPLSIIQGYAEGLIDGAAEDEETKEEYVSIIADEAGKMDKLVKNLLALNELEGEQELREESFDLAELIRDHLNSASRLIREAGADVIFSDDPMQVIADPERISMVVANYLSNALHHASGKKQIEITLRQRSGMVKCSVYNTGKQIPEEALPHLWDKFYKVDKARTRAYGGNGIGLSIVKAVMESMGGGYGVENRPEGVEFWFTVKNRI